MLGNDNKGAAIFDALADDQRLELMKHMHELVQDQVAQETAGMNAIAGSKDRQIKGYQARVDLMVKIIRQQEMDLRVVLKILSENVDGQVFREATAALESDAGKEAALIQISKKAEREAMEKLKPQEPTIFLSQ